jgi:hypothetical protein
MARKVGTRVPSKKANAPPTEVPVEAVAEVVPSPPDPDARTIAQQEEDEQVGFITRLRMRALDEAGIAAACRERFGIGRSRTHRLLQVVLNGIKDAVERNRPYTRAEQIARLRSMLSRLHGQLAEEVSRTKKVVDPKTKQVETQSATDNWAVVRLAAEIRQHEDLLADVEGNRAPDEIIVHGEVRESLQVVISNMTPEKTQELLGRALERRKAQLLLGSGKGTP